MGIQKYLINQGYKAMRVDFNKHGELIYVPNTTSSFSTMVGGGISIHYIKDNYKPIIYGLNEYGRPETLISPRPIDLCIKEYDSLNNEDKSKLHYLSDDVMNRILQKYSPKEIFDNLILK